MRLGNAHSPRRLQYENNLWRWVTQHSEGTITAQQVVTNALEWFQENDAEWTEVDDEYYSNGTQPTKLSPSRHTDHSTQSPSSQ